MPTQVKDWCATLNNYTEAEYANLVFLQFVTRRTMPTVKRLLDNLRLHLEKRRGTAQEASECCKKENDFVEFGTLSVQGQRTDLKKMVEATLNNATEEEQLEQFGDGCVQYRNHVKATAKPIIAERNTAAIKEQMQQNPLRPWQQVVHNALQHRPDPRKIPWIWDITGNRGKSNLATYLAVTQGAFVTSNGKSADIKYAYNG